MGSDTIPARSPGQVIQAAHHNLIRNILLQIMYGRNSSGVVADLAGDLGSTSFRWNDAAIKRILLGDAASNIQFKDDSGAFSMLVNGVEKLRVDPSDGISGTYKTNSIPLAAILDGEIGLTREVFTSNGTFTAPANVNRVILFGCGGGGGGGGGGGDNSGSANAVGCGGGGGQGAIPAMLVVPVTPSTGYSVVIGGGGAGGTAGSSSGGNGGVGTTGSDTIFGSTLATLYGAPGGNFGLGSTASLAASGVGGGAAKAAFTKYGLIYTGSGKGSDGEVTSNGSDGEHSIYGTGGSNPTGGGSTHGGSGGGGGAGYGNGGAGATQGVPGGNNGSSGSGNGSGGGGGSGAYQGGGSQAGGTGGNGANGFLWVLYVKES